MGREVKINKSLFKKGFSDRKYNEFQKTSYAKLCKLTNIKLHYWTALDGCVCWESVIVTVWKARREC